MKVWHKARATTGLAVDTPCATCLIIHRHVEVGEVVEILPDHLVALGLQVRSADALEAEPEELQGHTLS